MKKYLIAFIFLLYAFCVYPQQGSVQFRFKHNGHNFKRTVITPGAIFQHTTAAQKISDAALLNVKIIRTSCNFYSWNGTNSPESDSITSHGLFNILNVNEIATGSADYSTIDTADFASNCTILAAHLNPAKITAIVVFNEMGNSNYYSITTPTDMLPYVWCAKIAVRIFHAAGFKVLDGGFMPHSLVYWTYRQMSIAHDADTTNFLNYCVPLAYQSIVKNRSGTAINAEIANTDYLLTQFASVGFDGINLHLYMPFVHFMVDTATNFNTNYTGLTQICNYLKAKMVALSYTSMLPFYSNEFGIVEANYASAAIADARRNAIRYVVYYNDATQTLIVPVINGSNGLTEFGSAFKIIVQ